MSQLNNVFNDLICRLGDVYTTILVQSNQSVDELKPFANGCWCSLLLSKEVPDAILGVVAGEFAAQGSILISFDGCGQQWGLFLVGHVGDGVSGGRLWVVRLRILRMGIDCAGVVASFRSERIQLYVRRSNDGIEQRFEEAVGVSFNGYPGSHPLLLA